MNAGRRATIGLVVPSLENGGGVPAVAEFVCRCAEGSGAYDLRLVSLVSAMRGPLGVAISRPSSWLHPTYTASIEWKGRPVTVVGSFMSEFEFQRFRARPALAHALRGCDIIQVVAGCPAWANAVTSAGPPVSLQVATRAVVERRRRDAHPHTVADRWRRAMTAVTDRLDDRALRRVQAVQVENPWMLEYVTSINRDRADVDIRYAPPGVDAHSFRPASGRSPVERPYVLSVARFDDPRKNVELLLEALRLLPARMSGVELWTAGMSPPPAAYFDRARSLGLADRVRHVDRPDRAQLVQLYQDALAFALPSDEEGLGVVLLEAMACGTAVVATRCGGPDGIITDGLDGFLVERGDAHAMADRLAALHADPARRAAIAARGRATIEERYSEEVAGARFHQIWGALLERSRSGRVT